VPYPSVAIKSAVAEEREDRKWENVIGRRMRLVAATEAHFTMLKSII
jgi:hypothetical protein